MDLGALTAGVVTGLREGVEAALIVAIVLAYVVRSGNASQAGKVWLGTGLALLLSLVAGVAVFATVGSLRPPVDQYFEAGTMLVAAGVVTWMLFWMRRQSAGLRSSLNVRIEQTLSQGGAFGLGILAFSAVIREGLETSIFLVGQASSLRSTAGISAASGLGAVSLLVGALGGLVAAAGIGWMFYTGTRRIDLRWFFRWTGIALIFIAAGLLSKAVHELVEVGAITIATQPAFDLSAILPDGSGVGAFLRAILGYDATPALATLVVHVTYLVVVLAAYLRPFRVAPPAPRVDVPAESPGVAAR